MITVTRRFTFDSAHSLEGHPGKCAHLHGHTYTLEVEVARGMCDVFAIDMVVDFGNLDTMVKDSVITELDHKYLNDVLDYPRPTAEKLLTWIQTKLSARFQREGLDLASLKLWETPNSYATWRPNVYK